MFLDKTYPEEFIKPVQACLEFLKKLNITFSEVSFLERNWRFLYLGPLLVMHYLSLSVYIVKLFTENRDPFEKADLIPMWLVTTENWIKIVILMKNRDKIREVILHMGSSWRTTGLNEEQLKIKKTALKRLSYADIAFSKFALVVSWQYLLMPLLDVLFRKFVLNQEADFQLPFPCSYPFEISTWPVYLSMYAFQMYCILLTAYVYLGIGWLLMILTSFLTVQFSFLQEDLIHLKPEVKAVKKNNFQFVDEITPFHQKSGYAIEEFVIRHQDAIRMTDELNECFSEASFVIVLFATLVICFFAVAAKLSTSAAYAVNNYAAISVLMMNIFMICYYSQLLSSSSSGIAVAAMKSMWYKGDLRFQKHIQFIIMRSQKPCLLKLLGYSSIGLDTFNTVLKTTWSYFSLMSQMYDARN